MEKRVRKSTMIELVAELEAIEPRTPLIDFMIRDAKAGEYHDYKNTSYVCGKIALVQFATKAGLLDLAERVKNGEFDEEADDADKESMRQFLPSEAWPTFGLQK